VSATFFSLHTRTAAQIQGVVFAALGFLAGIVGTATSNGLLALRKTLDPNFKLVVRNTLVAAAAAAA
jgi:hypothetical protein